MQAATVTILFTDLVGSTELLRLGSDTFDQIRRAHYEAVGRALGAHRGEVVKSTGDGVMASFLSATDAVSASVAIQQAVQRLRARDRLSPEVRIGIATGEATFEDGDWYGEMVVVAARLCAAAQGSQTLAAEVVSMLVGSRGGHRFRPVGELDLKGFDTPTSAVEVQWDHQRAPTPPAVTELADEWFVGRAGELATLRSRWSEAAAGDRPTVLVSGEPGVGKTRLAAALAAEVGDAGGLVLWGRCDEELPIPYQPFREVLRWLAGDGPGLGPVSDPEAIALLVPEVLTPSTGSSTPSGTLASDPAVDPARLFEAVVDVIVTVAWDWPVLLVLDDLHWASEPTVSLLRHLLRDRRPAQLMVLGTFRDTDLDRHHPLAGALADLRREPTASRLSLSGLTQEGVLALVEEAAGSPMDHGPALADLIWAETGGNAFFVREVLRHLAETDQLRSAGHGRSGPTGGIAIPDGVREVLRRRLTRLPDEVDTLLSVAAVAGREFALSDIARVAEMPDDTALEAIEAATLARLVLEAGGAPGSYAFAHALVRQALLSEMSSPRRARLHRRLGTLLADRRGVAPGVVANHLCEGAAAGGAADALEWSLRAMETALQISAMGEIAAIGRRAAQVLELGADVDPALAARVLAFFARGLAWDGAAEEGREVAEQALALATKSGDVEARALALIARYGTPRAGRPEPETEQRIGEALELLDDLGEPGQLLAARLHLLLGMQLAIVHGDRRKALHHARIGTEKLRRKGAENEVFGALFDTALVLMGSSAASDLQAILAEMDRMLPELTTGRSRQQTPAEVTHMERPHTDDRTFDCARVRFVVGITRADCESVLRAMEEAEVIAHGPGPRVPQATLDMWRGALALAEGRLTDARAHADAMVDIAASDMNFRVSWAVLSFRLAMESMTAAQLLPVVDDAIAGAPGMVSLRALRALALLEAGRAADAGVGLDGLMEEGHFQPLPDDMTYSATVAQLAEVCADLAAVDAARDLHRLLLPFDGQVLVAAWGIYVPGAASRHLAMLEVTLGDLGAAVDHATRAIDLEERLGFAALAAHSRYWLARALATGGDTAAARPVLDEAEAVAAACQLDALLRRCDLLRRDLGTEPVPV